MYNENMKFILLIAMLFFTPVLHAKEGLSIFMDAEIYDWLDDMSTPLLHAADISKTNVNIYVANNNQTNAFATGGGAIVLYSGLILKSSTEDEVRGVLAHEIGHIKANHHLKASVKNERETLPTVIGAVLGLGAAAAGSPAAAQGLILGGIGASQTNILRHSRTHEWEADKIALDLLKKTNSNPKGFVNFFGKLRQEQLFYTKTPPQYLLTHPLSSARMTAAQSAVERQGTLPPEADNTKYLRIKAKLKALTTEPKKMLRILGYADNDNALYARAIAYALEGKTQTALKELNKIKNWQQDAYLNEFSALLYQDLSDLEKAHEHFTKAHILDKNNPIIIYTLATNLISLNRNQEAIRILRKLLIKKPNWPLVYYQLGIAYGKENRLVLSHCYLAERAIVINKISDAKKHLNIASTFVTKNTPAEDLNKLKHLKSVIKIEEAR